MKTRPFRHFLAIRAAWIALIPFLFSALLGWFWLRPQIIADTEEYQRQLAAVIASRTEEYLISSSRTISGAASALSRGLIARASIQEYMDSKLESSLNLTSITFTDARGRISAIALPGEKAHLRQEMVGIDLSLTNAVRQVRASGAPAWSDAFLSPVGGGLTVAYATPAAEGVALGEISLVRLSTFLKGIAAQGKHSIFIIDRRGQVIADQEGRYTARQHNLTNLVIVREGLASGQPLTRSFPFNGRKVVGSLTKAPILNWSILVMSPVEMAYRSALTTTGIFATALCLALILASGLALFISHSLATRFENLVCHARRIESGEEAGDWPRAPISEFNQLGNALQSMAETLRERENRLESFFSLSPDLLFLSDSRGVFRKLNKAWESTLGFGVGELIGRSIPELVHPDDQEDTRRMTTSLAEQPEILRFVNRCQCRDGSTRWLEWHAAPCGDQVYGIARDISNQKQAEERIAVALVEKEVLLKEVHHRVKNNMQIICSLLDLQSDSIPDEGSRNCLRESQNRIRSMALIHERLYESKNFSSIDAGAYIRDLSHYLFASYAVEGGRVSLNIEAENIHLEINRAVPCGLIINELMSNSLKHAFPDGRSGEISVRVGSDGGVITLEVADTGVGMPAGLDTGTCETLGLQLINMLTRQLRGRVSVDGGQQGTVTVISFPESPPP
jgi:PAS domain S-box-containing protein